MRESEKFLGLTHDLLDTSEEGESVEDVVKELGLEANSCFRCLNALQGEVLVEDIPQKDETEAELCINEMKVTYSDHGHFERCKEPFLLELGGRGQLTQGNIEAVVVEAIAEIVDVVSLNGINTIIYGSFKSSLSSSCEISLQGGGAGVQDTDSIGVICPCLTECFLKIF